MTSVVVLQSRPSACVVCAGRERVRAVSPIGAPRLCPHCINGMPVVILPWRDDSKDLRRTS